MKAIIGLLLCSITYCSFSQENTPATPSRGKYFAKKHYTPEAIPDFKSNKHMLPVPIIESHPEWVEMYWKAWEIAFKNIKQPPPGSPLVSNFLDEAFNEYIFQWDTHFMIMFARYGHRVFPAIQSHDNFYARQHDDGLIWRVIVEADGSDHPWGAGKNFARAINPPLFSWAEVESFKLTGDKSRFEMVLPVLEKYIEWIELHRKSVGTPHELYWSNGQASGMDNTPRDEGRPDKHSSSSPMGWVDMSCQMVMQYNDLATICKELDKPEKAKRYQQKAKAIANRINRWMWNEKDGLYYDVDPEGNQVKWKTAACFWPMLANITSKSQEEKLVGNLKDTASFWRPMIFPSLAADQKYYSPKGRYWHGSVWAPTNYIIIKGLQQQGYEDFAQIATKKYLDGLAKVFNTTGTLWECYAPDSFEPATVAEKDKLVRKDFVGWTGCGPIALLIENILGFRVDGVRKNITWHLTQSDKHGIQNLPCGDASVNLTAEPSPGEKNKYKIVVKPNAPITLTLVHPLKGNKKFNLKAEERVIYW